MVRQLSILVLVSVGVSSCSYICKDQKPTVVVVEKIPKITLLDTPELHTYEFKKAGDLRVITEQEFINLQTDLVALIDLINRYEKLIEDYNAMTDKDPGKVEEAESVK